MIQQTARHILPIRAPVWTRSFATFTQIVLIEARGEPRINKLA
jgi:hypothetical protein